MTTHKYDPDLPYVVASPTRQVIARFRWLGLAEEFSDGVDRIIDTTPKPRIPEDAKYITWVHRNGERWYAESGKYGWVADSALYDSNPDALPGVTPDTVFTVLEERNHERSQ